MSKRYQSKLFVMSVEHKVAKYKANRNCIQPRTVCWIIREKKKFEQSSRDA